MTEHHDREPKGSFWKSRTGLTLLIFLGVAALLLGWEHQVHLFAGEALLFALSDRERPEIDRRRATYREGKPPLAVAGKSVVIVDDSAATSAAMKVLARTMRRLSP